MRITAQTTVRGTRYIVEAEDKSLETLQQLAIEVKKAIAEIENDMLSIETILSH